jgi:hypothetical protein
MRPTSLLYRNGRIEALGATHFLPMHQLPVLGMLYEIMRGTDDNVEVAQLGDGQC